MFKRNQQTQSPSQIVESALQQFSAAEDKLILAISEVTDQENNLQQQAATIQQQIEEASSARERLSRVSSRISELLR